ncbi:MAG: FtsH protease activity modulator HflK [Candidatus Bipolaricaulota bacterium]|nr:FtsH protease activity modulator HflK [Candidatus Bipolaricaulota bacterium]
MGRFADRLLDDDSTGGSPDWGDFARRLPGGVGWIAIAVIIIIYLLTGIYTIGPSEVGLVKRFGKHVATVEPGMHYHLPAPMESVVAVNMLEVRKEEIGFRTISPAPNPRYQTVETEALMLTGDGNVTHVEMIVQYRVKEAEKFAFNLILPKVMVKQAAEAVLREQVATRTIDETLTEERDLIGTETRDSLQTLLNSYGAGVLVGNVQLQDVKPPREVISAFDDVNSARQDKEKLINQAEEYEFDILPRARGQAQEIGNQSEAYKQERIKRAQGDVARFVEVLKKYQLGEEVTRTRLYIETMEEILPGMEKIILSQNATGVLQLLDLQEVLQGGEGE